MGNRDLKRRLADYLDRTGQEEIDDGQIRRTVARCVGIMRQQPAAPAGDWTSFWRFLSDVFHFEGIALLLPQGAVLLATCLVAASSPLSPYALPMYMPLFILAVIPTFFRGQRWRVSEMEAATRTSGAQLALARLILACGATLTCVTFLLGLEVWLQHSWENLGRMVLYCLVPYLTCMTAMLALIRKRVKDGGPLCAAAALGSVAFWRFSSVLFPWLYEVSALGIWIAAVLAYAGLFAKEVAYIIRAGRDVDMYGVVG